MEYVQVYKCLCDMTRLRVLNLLMDGPLCVCHIHEILAEPQPKISKHLNLMREAGMLESERCYNWTIYRITRSPIPVLTENLRCLQDLRATEAQFRSDLEVRERVVANVTQLLEDTPGLRQAMEGSGPCC